jgi:hypothetical protein
MVNETPAPSIAVVPPSPPSSPPPAAPPPPSIGDVLEKLGRLEAEVKQTRDGHNNLIEMLKSVRTTAKKIAPAGFRGFLGLFKFPGE